MNLLKQLLLEGLQQAFYTTLWSWNVPILLWIPPCEHMEISSSIAIPYKFILFCHICQAIIHAWIVSCSRNILQYGHPLACLQIHLILPINYLKVLKEEFSLCWNKTNISCTNQFGYLPFHCLVMHNGGAAARGLGCLAWVGGGRALPKGGFICKFANIMPSLDDMESWCQYCVI